MLRLDVTDADSVRAAGEQVTAAGPLHGLVNNAGVALPAPLEHIPIEVFRRQMEVNLIGQLAVTQAMLPALRQAREKGMDARIVMIGSIGGRIAAPMLGAYHASKFGMVGLADTLRAELAPSSIKVILIEPGAIATPIWDRGGAAGNELIAGLPEEGRQRYADQIAAAQSSAAKSARRGLPPGPRGAGRGQGADHRQPAAQVPDRTGRARRRRGRPATAPAALPPHRRQALIRRPGRWRLGRPCRRYGRPPPGSILSSGGTRPEQPDLHSRRSIGA